jgi:GNAT superfamily N-acetyltransferase
MGLVALSGQEPGADVMGAAWARPLPADNHGYGYVADDVPELGMAVLPAYRGQGVGSALLSGLMAQALSEGWTRLSLSVEDGNGQARRRYQRQSFAVVGRAGDSDTMVASLTR